MTATPIPRTIALSLYADLDVSYLDELPPGRITIATRVVHQSKRNTAYTWIQDQITTRHTQAFLVCPLITDSETPKLDQVKAAVSEFDHIRAIFPQLKIGLLHGRMPQKSKTQVTDDFVNRKLDILVTTPVIEVGVDIPNATIMVIEGAERFGLASLHQLRGRVGRSHQKSYCLLFPTKQSTSRLKLMESTSSGLKLAEADLKLRGPGDLYGVKQSGYIDLKLASLADTKLLETSLHQVKSLLRSDPNLQHHPRLKHQLELQLDNHSLPN